MPPDHKDDARLALLPAGLSDALPPAAAQKARTVERLMAGFAAHGYERVEPPLVEFEETLLGAGLASLSGQTFRVMDPVSQRMMGVRSDITPQIARIATTRLAKAARPLRLSYAGDVLRVKGAQLRPERQFTQAGVELIGNWGVEADVEIVQLAADSLIDIGIANLSVDLNNAPLVHSLLTSYEIDPKTQTELRAALDRKDAEMVAALGGRAATALAGLLAATGPAHAALMILTSIELPEAPARHLLRLTSVIEELVEALPGITLTVDPVESRGFEYHSGVGFALFANGVRGELGRGGRYIAGGEHAREPATGFSLFMDSVMRALGKPEPSRRVFLPLDTPRAVGLKLREDGWVTIAGLDAVTDSDGEAARMGCSHAWHDGAVKKLGGRR
jgi:ATP phosphoribosyltransferase regulatory subunit